MQVHETAVLLADISDSVSLYARVGDEKAARCIIESLNHLEQLAAAVGGSRLRSRGDDLLCVFADCQASFRAACDILSGAEGLGVSIHGSLNFGEVATAGGDIFGDVLNTAARLAAKANPGEFLVTEAVVAHLSEADKLRLLPLDRLSLRGKTLPTTVFTLQPAGDDLNTRITMLGLHEAGQGGAGSEANTSLRLHMQHRDRTFTCFDAEAITLGRAPGCEIQIPRPWVSRRHAVVSLSDGRARLRDRSSSGTYLEVPGQLQTMLVRRETVVLPKQGVISPALAADTIEAEPITFELVEEPDW